MFRKLSCRKSAAWGMLLGGLLLNLSVFYKAHAEEINLIAGLPKAPFIIEENGRGMQLELIREALNFHNIDVNFTHLPMSRNVTSFQSLNADGVITLPQSYSYPGLYMSKPYIAYQNVAVSLAESNIKIEKIEDLSGKSVVAFQNARKFLNETYGEVVSYSMDYREVADQNQQIEMLFMRQAEVIVLDAEIFKYFVRINNEAEYEKAFVLHPIFKPRLYSVGFRDETIRDKFDQGVQLLKDQGLYQAVFDKYLN